MMETEEARQRRLMREREHGITRPTTTPTPTTITADLARRLRFCRGLALPIDSEYATPRLKSIAVLQFALLAELQRLDEELLTIV